MDDVCQGCVSLSDAILGIADGAQVPFDSILTLNVRTEISMGLMTDGCTSLAWKTPNECYMAQNWDVSDKMVVLRVSNKHNLM